MFSKFSVKILQSTSRLNHTAIAGYSPRAFKVPPTEAKSEIKKSAEKSKYRIELAKPSDTNRILYFMDKSFISQDPLSKSLRLDKNLDKTLEACIAESLTHGMTILAQENSCENRIVGVCINQKSCKWDGDRLDRIAKSAGNINARKLLHIKALLAREPAMHDYLAQLSIFNMAFISVTKTLQGQELATELAKRSLSLGRDLNYNFARIDCTDEFTKQIAEKFKMERLLDVPYESILSDDGRTPVAVPARPNTHAAVYYINLKTMPDDLAYLGMELDSKSDEKKKQESRHNAQNDL